MEDRQFGRRSSVGSFGKRNVDTAKPSTLLAHGDAPNDPPADPDPSGLRRLGLIPRVIGSAGSMAAQAQVSFEDDLADFFGPRAERYLRIYRSDKRISWNWGVFFLGFVWFFYRKQYALGFTLLFLPWAISYFVGMLGHEMRAGPLLGMLVVFAMSADRWYVDHAVKRVARVGEGLSGDERVEALQEAGGVSWFAAGLAAIPFVVLNLLAALSIFVTMAKIQS